MIDRRLAYTVLVSILFISAIAIGVVVTIQVPPLALGVLAALLLGLVGACSPRAAAAVWLIVVVAIPFWTTYSGFGVTVNSAFVSLPLAAGIGFRRLRYAMRSGGSAAVHFRFVDAVVVAGVVLALLSTQVFGQAAFLTTNVAITLFGGYVIGRLVPLGEARRTFAVVMLVIAAWGIIEFAFGLHIFETWLADRGGLGPIIQERGGLARSEASLGHAIAYGACLAAAIPMVREFKRATLWQILLAVGILVSVSRGPIIAGVFAFALVAYTASSAKARLWSALLLVVGLVGAYFVFSLLYEGAGQSDVTLSQQARDTQITQTLPYINIFGPASGTQLNLEGLYEVAGVDKVDSAPLRLALDFGWLTMALLLFPLAYAAWRVLVRRAGPATVALATQIPIVLVTSYITQWQTILYFIAGLAITECVRESSQRRAARAAGPAKKPVDRRKSVAR